jgi:hypothetical protein
LFGVLKLLKSTQAGALLAKCVTQCVQISHAINRLENKKE